MEALVITSDRYLFAGTGEANPGGGSLTLWRLGHLPLDRLAPPWQQVGLTNSGAIGRLAVEIRRTRSTFFGGGGRPTLYPWR